MSEQQEQERTKATGKLAQNSRAPFPDLQADRYKPMLADMDLTDEQADELLRVLWNIMCGFVDLGFGSNSIQRILPSILGEFSEHSADRVQSTHSRITTRLSKSGGDDEDQQ